MEPGVESVRIAEPGQVTPGDHQRFLHGILGPIDVAEDPLGERVEAVATDADQVGVRLPVTVPCRLDEIAIHRLRILGGAQWGRCPALWGQGVGWCSIFASGVVPEGQPSVSPGEARGGVEPTLGLEPRTCCLRNSCSTTELCRREAKDSRCPAKSAMGLQFRCPHG